MKTFKGVSETENKCLMRCAGVIRKEGWPKDASGMIVNLYGPVFYRGSVPEVHPSVYSKEYLEQFMEWQEKEFG